MGMSGWLGRQQKKRAGASWACCAGWANGNGRVRRGMMGRWGWIEEEGKGVFPFYEKGILRGNS
jgi:hypothetical protein